MSRKPALVMSLTLVLLGMLNVAAKAQRIETTGTIKAGDWIKYEITITGELPGETIPTWMKFEFLNVEGTNATVEVMIHLSDGTDETRTVDVVSSDGFIISPNSKTGDSVYMGDHGNITIDGETTSSYTGVNRTLIYASFSVSGGHFTYYWDKQTGIMLEQRKNSNDTTTIYKVKDTNMWQTQQLEPPLAPTIFYVMMIIVAVAVAVLFLRTRKKRRRRRARRKGYAIRRARIIS